jgi:hypothetical protein
MNSAPRNIGVGDRITIVDKVGALGNGSDGQSLRGLNVNMFPDATLVFVRNSNRMYRLKKNQAISIVEDTSGMDNVVNGIGSSAAAGRFVALVQMGIGTLAPGVEGGPASVVIPGFDVNPGGWFHVNYTEEPTSAIGGLWAVVNTETSVLVRSTETSDATGVFVTYYETPEGE